MLYQMFNCLCRARPVILAALLAIGSPFAYAVHDDSPAPQLFELDANTVDSGSGTTDDPAGTADDWEALSGSGTGHSRATSHIVADTDAKVFTGGSKDTKDINQWRYRAGGSPPKADLTHAYTAAYGQGSDLIIYFGANRDSNNGTTTTGFWFFKNPVCAKPDGTFGGGDSNDVGNCTNPNAPPVQHAQDDTLVVVNYDNGGKVGKIVVYRWNVNPGALEKIVESTNQLGSGGSIFCTDKFINLDGDDLCAITNKDTTDIPWASPVPPGAFFEGGINVSKVIGGKPCFASFMATSRSSTTEVAEIKNFILHSFPVCGISLAKTCSGTPAITSDGTMLKVQHTATIKAEGDVFDVKIKELIGNSSGLLPTGEQCKLIKVDGVTLNPAVVLISDSLPAITHKVAESLANAATLTLTIECNTHDNPMTNKLQAIAGSSDEAIDLTATHIEDQAKGELAACGLTPAPGLSATKTCDTVKLLGGVTPEVCVNIRVTNTGDEAINEITVSDNKIASPVITGLSLAPGEYKEVQGCYQPIYDAQYETNPALITYKDQLSTVSGKGAISNTNVSLTGVNLPTAECPVCK
ncbi:hypothetical protein [Vogesella indigofera]|uniref:hypothetical protein n=1 Tax=Vogesella indigofera TaxID=45465 RepID=UPI00234F25CC|nr:hypothetical protein [Vogesella indigofera]MDC7708639.1 hypothetical protein [Vogesella indigofera]